MIIMIEEWKVYKDSTYNVTNRNGKTFIRKSGKGGIWEVSNLGNVKKNGKIIKPTISNSGYLVCAVGLIHRMVAALFILNPDNKQYVDHIDTNRLNNRVDNLRWVTASENNLNKNTVQKRIGQKRSAEQRKRISIGTSKAEKGKKWYNDGKYEFFIYPNNKKENYKDGRLFHPRKPAA